jgi:hypothetical protein
MKTLIKLIIAAAIIHATWKAGNAYLRFWQFKEEVTEIAQFGVHQADNVLHNRVLDTAKRMEIPIDAEKLTVQRRQARIVIDASYVEPVELIPSYFYPWHAKMHVDVLTLVLQEAK